MTDTQLTKDDIMIASISHMKEHKYLDFSKFLEVRAFYEKYKDQPQALYREQLEIYQIYEGEIIREIGESNTVYMNNYRDWLFFHCFKDGLK